MNRQRTLWLRGDANAFEHFHGLPTLVIPDNAKTGVSKAHRYDPDLIPAYYNFALRCGFGIAVDRRTDADEASGYSLQANRKTKEGTNHPDRNAQFEHLNGK